MNHYYLYYVVCDILGRSLLEIWWGTGTVVCVGYGGWAPDYLAGITAGRAPALLCSLHPSHTSHHSGGTVPGPQPIT